MMAVPVDTSQPSLRSSQLEALMCVVGVARSARRARLDRVEEHA